jgi:hypothetical protein
MIGNKYGNIKTIIDGIKFDSQKEANRYFELKLLLKSGQIKDLELQPKFKICDSIRYEGKMYRERYYIADFMYTESGTLMKIVEDVKSPATSKDKVYTLKKQLFLLRYSDHFIFMEV